MKATSGSSIPVGDEWGYELKWDGMRLQIAIDSADVTMERSDRGRLTTAFPELQALRSAVDLPVRLDGEVVVFDGARTSFRRLQSRIHVEQPSRTLIDGDPAWFMIFDLLAVDGRSTTSLPLADRRRLLHTIIDDGPRWRISPLFDDPTEPWKQVEQHGLEGLVAKRTASPYRPGRRSADWVKVKRRGRQELVVLGWIEGSDGLRGQLGSLVVGYRHDAQWIPAGSVGSGISESQRAAIGAQLHEGPPLSDEPEWQQVNWVVPELVVEVAFGEWEPGHRLRHPTFEGIRADASPEAVELDPLGGPQDTSAPPRISPQ